MNRLFIGVVLLFILASCTHNPLKINTSNIQIDLKMRHLDVDLLKLDKEQMPAAIPELKSKYGEFFDIFTYRMISIGGTEQENFPELLSAFVSDSLIRNLKTKVTESVDTLQLRKELEAAFKYYKYYFPQKSVPYVFTCISGFNQSVVTSERIIGVSLDKYMGVKSPFYEQLGLPVYKRRNMHQGKIVSDMMYAWAQMEWPKEDKANNLLSQMIQEGKVLYFVEAMMPEVNDTLKIGYTKEQLDFCTKNEASMWTYLAEHKLLYTTDRMSIKRFIDDGPYTASFSEQSPARTGCWLGWQIVRSYMKKNEQVKLADLMRNQDFQSILNQSGYQP